MTHMLSLWEGKHLGCISYSFLMHHHVKSDNTEGSWALQWETWKSFEFFMHDSHTQGHSILLLVGLFPASINTLLAA